jgi:hypothetical protein
MFKPMRRVVSGDGDFGEKFANQVMGKLLKAWAEGDGQSLARPDHCGGALLFVCRDEAEAMVKGGVRFTTPTENLPGSMRDHIRVECRDFVRVKKGVTYGLCDRCCGFEIAIRKRLAEFAKKAAEKKPKGGSRRGSFDE